MTQLTRYCAGCSEDRPFEQLHAEPDGCPDVPDGDCPEWGCLVCGDAFLIGLPAREPASTASTVRAALSGASTYQAHRGFPPQRFLAVAEPVTSHETWCFGMKLRYAA